MSKYHTLVAIEPVGNQELGMTEFVQESDSEHNIVYLYVSGDMEIPVAYYEDLPACEHPTSDVEEENWLCGYGEHLVNRTIKFYTDLGFDVSIVSMGSLISPLQ